MKKTITGKDRSTSSRARANYQNIHHGLEVWRPGRDAGVGRALAVAVGLGATVGVGVGVTVDVAVGVGDGG